MAQPCWCRVRTEDFQTFHPSPEKSKGHIALNRAQFMAQTLEWKMGWELEVECHIHIYLLKSGIFREVT